MKWEGKKWIFKPGHVYKTGLLNNENEWTTDIYNTHGSQNIIYGSIYMKFKNRQLICDDKGWLWLTLAAGWKILKGKWMKEV